jgi:ketosteroid isomerase-like protein
VTIFAAAGGHETGFERISALLTAVSKTLNWETWGAENLSTRIDGNLAITVELERRTRHTDGGEQKTILRATQVYRRESEGWKVVHRQGDLLTLTP